MSPEEKKAIEDKASAEKKKNEGNDKRVQNISQADRKKACRQQAFGAMAGVEVN